MYTGIHFITFSNRVYISTNVFNLSFRHSLKDDFDKEISCVACHPTEDSFVTGCDNGKIIYW